MSAAEDLFRQALALPEDERRVLAERLLETVESDGVLEAIAAAPLVPWTEQERAAIAELEGDPAGWLTTEEVVGAISKPQP